MRDRVGRYQVTGVLGEGGMGIVYAAFDDRLQRTIAVKTLRGSSESAASRVRLEREARAAASVNHPAICQLFELGEEDGEQFIAMELLEGESLATRLGRGPLPVAEAVGIALGVLAGLGAAHRQGLVHRDVKPSNIFLTAHGVKLLDFGIAATSAPIDLTSTRLTQPGTLLGTPLYAAPEQLRGETVDARTDLFAAAVVLYEMLAGRPPFIGQNVLEVYHAVLYDQPPMLGGAAAPLDRVLRRALAKRPGERYPTVEDMAADLRMVLPTTDAGGVTARAVTRLIVLPFRLLRPDTETEFLAFSLADAVTNSLAGLQALVVRSSAAALRFGADADLKEVASAAQVDAVLLGTMIRSGAELRVSAQLVEAPAATVLWSQTIQVPVGDLFRVQDEITARLVESLSIPLTARERTMLKQDVPASPRAYDLYLRANELARSTRQWPAALALYEEAVAEDPRYAPVWAGLGRLHRMIAKYVGEAADEHLSRSKNALERALELNSGLSLAETNYAYLEVDLGRAEAAMVRRVRRARERPSDPELFAGIAHAARYCGLLQASVAAAEHASRLDPAIRTSVVQTHFLRGDYERVLGSGPDSSTRAFSLAALGRTAEAIAVLEGLDRSVEDLMVKFTLAQVAVFKGEFAEAIPLVGWLIGQIHDPEGQFHLARLLAMAGDANGALDVLRSAVATGFFCLPAIVRDPSLDSLRAMPGFASVLRDAETQHRRAVISFLTAEGDRVLGLSSPV
jgi:TolB-like protein